MKERIEIANLSFLSDTTYNNLQVGYVFPAVNKIYNAHKESIIVRACEGESLHLLGDERCNSPGCSAKYGTYKLMNRKSGTILHFNVIHVALAEKFEKMELTKIVTNFIGVQECNCNLFND